MSSPLRISGLASGMDIDSMVKSLMTAERMPLDKLKQKQQVLEWQRDDYRSMNTLLLNFRTDLTNMKLTTNYRARTTTSTNDAQVTATASSAASQGSYSISNVSQLATAATLQNTGAISSGSTKVDLNKSIFDQYSGQAVWSQGSVESKTFTVTSAGTVQNIGLQDPTKLSLVDLQNTNVKVNGKAYTVVDGSSPLQTGQVVVGSDGSLTFGDSIAANSTIKVDYFANEKMEQFNPTANTNDFQLAHGSISNVLSFTVTDSSTNATDSYTIDPSNNNLYKNGDTSTAVGTFDRATGKIHFNDAITSTQQVNIEYKQNYTAFSVSSYTSNGFVKENFGVQGSDTLNQVISRVNGSNAGVTMFYDSFSDRMTMTRKETGNFHGTEPVTDPITGVTSAGDPEIEFAGSFIEQTLKFAGGTETGGQNAHFTVNGLDTQRSSNTFDMNGVTFTLKQTFTTGKVDIGINNDTDTVFNNIKGFIDKYNTLIDTINKKKTEDYYRDYPPLTDDQKTQLSDTQQQQWTDKAKSGLLRGDTILTGALNGMRTNFYAPVNNSQVSQAYNQLAKVGITTTANFLDGGKLQIDDAKLKAAIQADPDSVENLFRGTGSTSSEKGIVLRLYDTVNNTMDSLKQKAGNTYSTNKQFSIGMQLDSLTSQISSFESRMTQVEDRYYRQFTAMEQAIQKSNSQASYLMQQFSGGGQ